MFQKKSSSKILYSLILIFCLVLVWYNVTPRQIIPEIVNHTVFENEHVKVQKKYIIPRLAISYNHQGTIYATEDHYLYSKNDGNSFLELGNFNKDNPTIAQRVKDFVARLKIVRKFRKNLGANNCVVLKTGTILVFFDKIYRSTDNGKSFQSVYNFKANQMFQPFNHGVAVDKNDDIYFGEYNANKRPHQIRILKGSQDGLAWSVFYRFPPGDIFHIHSITYDVYRDVFWVCTGDRNDESRLMSINTNRNGINVLGKGDQGWRIVSLIVTKDALFWCSDDDSITGSKIYRYDFDAEKRLQLKHVGYPSYYSTRLKDGTLVFSTVVEPDSVYSQKNKPEHNVELWISRTGEQWFKALSLPGKIHQTPFGSSRPHLILPSGDYTSNLLYLTPILERDSNFSIESYEVIWKNKSI